ncbi:uncharacterized protein LOC135581757 isoform X2 [Musa acuminata AAA Group]|uniref:uncharacterized protein LOC135581757 isoform X2 n=1 Tax=Musa acuminata AAA Group TaxID=214697 RepID=UPI0031D88D9E
MAATVPPVAHVYFGKPMLPDVSRVLACLYEKDIAFELVDMYEGHRMPADILKLQATMRAPVPAFKDTDTFLLESRAICRYVSEKYAEHGNKYLLGRDLLDRGSIEQWLKTEEQSFNPPSWALVFHLAFAPLTNGNELDQSLVTESEKMLGNVLDVYEHRLRESKYLAGDEFTLADLSHLPNTHYLVNSRQWNHLFNSRKNIQRWWEKISNRPSWTKVVAMLNEVETPKSSAAEEVATAREAKISHLSQTPAAATASQTSPQSTPVVPQSTPEVKTSPRTAATASQASPQSTPVVPRSTPEVKTSPQTAATASQASPQSTPAVPQSTPEVKTSPQTAATASQASPQSTPVVPQSTPVVKTSPQTAATASQASPQSTPVVPQSTPEVKTSPQTAATASQASPQSTPVVPQSTPEVKTSPQTAATASQTSPRTAAPEPSSKPSLEQKSSKSSADKPDSAIDQQSSPKGPTSNLISQSEPATQPTPQSQQGTSETKATSQPDSTASSTASDKPNSQPSGDKPAS